MSQQQHLPECPVAAITAPYVIDLRVYRECICKALRLCRDRALADASAAIDALRDQT